MKAMAELEGAVVEALTPSDSARWLRFAGTSGPQGREQEFKLEDQCTEQLNCEAMAQMPLESLLYHVCAGPY